MRLEDASCTLHAVHQPAAATRQPQDEHRGMGGKSRAGQPRLSKAPPAQFPRRGPEAPDSLMPGDRRRNGGCRGRHPFCLEPRPEAVQRPIHPFARRLLARRERFTHGAQGPVFEVTQHQGVAVGLGKLWIAASSTGARASQSNDSASFTICMAMAFCSR